MTRSSGPPPTEATLKELALRHLSRFGTTKFGLARALERHVMRWTARASDTDTDAGKIAAAAREAIPRIVASFAAFGAVDDAGFAATRARRLAQAGRSRRTVAAHLQARGVDPETIASVLPEDELAAAAITMRRRRIGAFRAAPVEAETRAKELAALARAGFSQEIADRALALDRPEAEALITRCRHSG